MRSMNYSKVKFWSDHLAAANQHPAGISAYCKEHSLSATMYYKWKIKLHEAKGEKRSAFLPVTVAAPEVIREGKMSARELPDAHWVADVMLHLIRGLQ